METLTLESKNEAKTMVKKVSMHITIISDISHLYVSISRFFTTFPNVLMFFELKAIVQFPRYLGNKNGGFVWKARTTKHGEKT